MKHFGLFLMAAMLFLTSCSINTVKTSNDHSIIISVATSLTDVMHHLVEFYEQEHPNTTITINIGGSGNLSRQIQQGAPTDVFISADEHFMTMLKKENLILENTMMNVVTNKLVLIANSETDITLQTLHDLMELEIDQIAFGNPDSVPAGRYGKEALVKEGIWDEPILQEKIVLAKDVRQVLTYVSSGNAEVGLVYESDLIQDDSVKKIYSIDDALHSPIVYPAAVTATSENQELAKDFLSFLQKDKAKEIFEKYGFTD